MTDEKTTMRRQGARKSDPVLTDEERAAIQEYRRERTRSSRPRRAGKKDEADGEADVLAKIARLDEPDHSMAERLHAIVKAAAPELSSRTWYGSPAYYREGNLICYFQERAKFKARYATLGFSDKAHLDDGSMWPIVYALPEMTPADEARITALIKKAVS
jgi:uncharacterized protein YdhG (YjbR/CyaY superfamily)